MVKILILKLLGMEIILVTTSRLFPGYILLGIFILLVEKKVKKKTIFRKIFCDDSVSLHRNDALPTVLLEAWAKRVPVIASSIGSIPFLITHKKNGFLVRPKSAKLLSEGLRELLHSQSLRDTIIKNANMSLKNHFLLKDTILKLNKLFLSIYKQKQIKKTKKTILEVLK